MSIRLRRLAGDYDLIKSKFKDESRIKILKTVGRPPEKYQIEYHLSGLVKDYQSGEIRSSNSFIAEITLTGSYPRLAPQCKMITPTFHPNIAPHAICIGDHWAAGESLAYLIVRIAEMLSFQSYNVKSPLDGEAANWAEKHMKRLPLDTFDFNSLLEGSSSDNDDEMSSVCTNCNAQIKDSVFMRPCENGHITCRDCKIKCNSCDDFLCLDCNPDKSAISQEITCETCLAECSSCKRNVEPKNRQICKVSSEITCNDCIVKCAKCKEYVSLTLVKKVIKNEKKYLVCEPCLLIIKA